MNKEKELVQKEYESQLAILEPEFGAAEPTRLLSRLAYKKEGKDNRKEHKIL